MIQTLYTGATGLTGQQKNIDVIANNVANMETDGYKKSRFDFQDCLYVRMRSPVDNSPEKNLQRGNGAIAYQTARSFAQGPLLESDRRLDFAIEGRGFFVVENPAPQDEDGSDTELYSRAGSFFLSTEEDGDYLVDAQGRYVLGENGERVLIPDPSTLTIDKDGTMFCRNADGSSQEIGRLAIRDFTNQAGLAAVGGNDYKYTANCGEMTEALGKIKQNCTEGSNVDYSEEVTRMIRAQRAYQLAARCVSTADQMMGVANTIRQ